MKKVLLGFVLGLVLAVTVQGFANSVDMFTAQKATFDILVNGNELDTTDKPAVVIDGSTYLPLKKTGEALGVDVNWNAKNRRVEIGKMETVSDVLIEPTKTPVATSSPAKGISAGEIKRIDKYVKSDVLEINCPYLGIAALDDKNEYYLELVALGAYVKIENFDYSIALPDKEPLLVVDDFKETEHSRSYIGRFYIKLSSLGLKARIEGDTVWVEWI